jgi:hypothetical protein
LNNRMAPGGRSTPHPRTRFARVFIIFVSSLSFASGHEGLSSRKSLVAVYLIYDGVGTGPNKSTTQ